MAWSGLGLGPCFVRVSDHVMSFQHLTMVLCKYYIIMIALLAASTVSDSHASAMEWQCKYY